MIGNAREITQILEHAPRDAQAEAQLYSLISQRFYAIAHGLLQGERAGHSLQATMLVDDAFLQLIRGRDSKWRSRQEFFAHAAKVMRHLLVDHARARRAVKRGAGKAALQLEHLGQLPGGQAPDAILELNEVLERLEQEHPDVFMVFDLHYFMRYELREIAEDILDVSYTTVRRRWKMARVFLRQALLGEEA